MDVYDQDNDNEDNYSRRVVTAQDILEWEQTMFDIYMLPETTRDCPDIECWTNN